MIIMTKDQVNKIKFKDLNWTIKAPLIYAWLLMILDIIFVLLVIYYLIFDF